MIQPKSLLKAADNSGAKEVKCIKVLKGFFSKKGLIGDTVVVSIKTLRFQRKVRCGEIYYGIVIRNAQNNIYKDGSYTKFKTNSVVLFNKKKKIIGTRLFGPISKNLRRKKLMRILLMCAYNIL